MASMATAWRRPACLRRSPNWSELTAKMRLRNSWKGFRCGFVTASFRQPARSSRFAARKTVIARLDRATQYSRGAGEQSRGRGVLDHPVKAGGRQLKLVERLALFTQNYPATAPATAPSR